MPDIYSDRPRGEVVERCFDTTASALPELGTFGTAGRNILTGPRLFNINGALVKEFGLAEGTRFELRWEVFNVANRPNFGKIVF